MTLQIHQFRCLSDNFGFLARDEATGRVAAIDAPDADAYVAALDALGWTLDMIVNTHWHRDHTGGNEALKARYGCPVIGPAEVRQVGPIDREIAGGDTVPLGETLLAVIDTGGHTHGHVALHDAAGGVVFCGDALFTLGCGRMFEGTPHQFADSLARLVALPDATIAYGAHDYTAGNLAFALSVDDGAALAARAVSLRDRIAGGASTVPTTIGEERATNPFLRARALPIAADATDDAEAFRIVRAAKDSFSG